MDFYIYISGFQIQLTLEFAPIRNGTYALGDVVAVPSAAGPLFAEISITPNVLGKLASVLLKSSQLRISLTLKNGTIKTYRLVSNMAKSGFIISPLIESTSEFGLLYAQNTYLDSKAVKSFSIVPVGGGSFWKKTFDSRFQTGQHPSSD